MTPRGKGAKPAKPEEYLPVFGGQKSAAGREPWDPKVHEHVMLRVARGCEKRGIGKVRPMSPERLAEIRAMQAEAGVR